MIKIETLNFKTLLYTRILEWKSHDIMPKFNRRFSPLMGNKISAVEEFKVMEIVEE